MTLATYFIPGVIVKFGKNLENTSREEMIVAIQTFTLVSLFSMPSVILDVLTSSLTSIFILNIFVLIDF
jgi:hypothetical protein